jgi:hypothetical protein
LRRPQNADILTPELESVKKKFMQNPTQENMHNYQKLQAENLERIRLGA